MLQRLGAFMSSELLYVTSIHGVSGLYYQVRVGRGTILQIRVGRGTILQIRVGRGIWKNGEDGRISVATLCIIVFDVFNVKYIINNFCCLSIVTSFQNQMPVTCLRSVHF